MKLSTRGLQVEIVASLLLVMLAAVSVVAAVFASLALQAVQRGAFDRLEVGSQYLSRSLAARSIRLSDLAVQLRAQSGGEWIVLDDAGEPLLAPDQALPPDVFDAIDVARRTGREVRGAGWPLEPLLWIERVEAYDRQRGFLLGLVPVRQQQAHLLPLLRAGAWVLGFAVLMFVGFGSYLLRMRIVQPLSQLIDATRRVASGDLEVRTGAQGFDEIAELSRSFDEMADSLARERDTVLRAFESLSRSDRLATVGRLAAGVAHEVGNPVAAILGYAEVVLRDLSLSARTRDSVSAIRRESLRVRALVRQLLDLARPTDLSLEPHTPRALLEGVAAILRPQKVLAGIELSVVVPQDLPRVSTDVRHVEQIVINLVENAAHALRGVASPRVELRALVSTLPFRRDVGAGVGASLERARAVVLQVSDNGSGIAPEHLESVFDPFFSTKDPGEGTGLGLWNAHRLAVLLQGRLEVESRAGETCFRLILPLADT